MDFHVMSSAARARAVALAFLLALVMPCTALAQTPSDDPAQPGGGSGETVQANGGGEEEPGSGLPEADEDDDADGEGDALEGGDSQEALTEEPDEPGPEDVPEGPEDPEVPDTANAVIEPAAVTGAGTPQGDERREGQSGQDGAAGGTGGTGTGQMAEISVQAASPQKSSRPTVTISVSGHVQNKGWEKWLTLSEGGVSVGTTGKSLRLEALQFKLAGVQGGIQMLAHVQNIGWQGLRGVSADGKPVTVGTTGQSLRVEALRLCLTGEISKWYDLSYRAHVQNEGWQKWASNGEMAGTTGRSLRLESLEIRLVPKKQEASSASEGIIGIRTRAHVQNVGWQGYVDAGATSGTTGRSLRVEAVGFSLDAGVYGGGIQVRTHVQNKGWIDWQNNQGGTTGQSLRMEAVQLRLTGGIASQYDVMYRAHVQNVGWQPWTVENGVAGTTGKSLRIEAIQVKLVKKNSTQSVSDGAYFIAVSTNPASTLSSSGGSGAQAKTSGYSGDSLAERYYVRNEYGGVTLQNVSTGMFLQASGKSVVQGAWGNGAAAQVWKLGWNAGYALTNASSGANLALSGSSAVNGGSTRWTMTRTDLIPEGSYIVGNAASGKVLDVQGASWDNGANVMVGDANNGGNQCFSFANKGNDVYTITCVMTSKAVDVKGGSKAEGANVQQYAANGSNAQKWKATLERDGRYVFTNQASGKALTAAGAAGSGANVSSSAYKGAANQKWTLKAGSWSLTGDSALDSYVLNIVNSNGRDLRRCYDWMGNLRHVQSASSETIRGIADRATMNRQANIARNRGVADCYVDGALLAWLARACGYSANFRGGGCPSASGGVTAHGWTEVYINGTTYVCDRNLARDLPSYNWYMNTYSNSPVTYSIW